MAMSMFEQARTGWKKKPDGTPQQGVFGQAIQRHMATALQGAQAAPSDMDALRKRQDDARAALDAKSAALDSQASGVFNTYRQRAQQQGGVQKQTQGEALKRRFASIGNLNSGAYIKAAGLQDQEIDQATNQAVQDVDLQEQQMKAQGAEAEKGRLFQRDLADRQADTQMFQFDKQYQLQLEDFKLSKLAQRLNTLSAIDSLSDDALEAASGESVSGGFLGIGASGQEAAKKKLFKQYGNF